MKCPFCSSLNTQVKDSRSFEDNIGVRRRRICTDCYARFNTVEKLFLRSFNVTKRNGSVEPFNRQKLLKSIFTATKKRPVSVERINMMVSSILYDLEGMKEEVTAITIGRIVMEKLILLDSVSYIRFASVYMGFKDAEDFSNMIIKLIEENSIN